MLAALLAVAGWYFFGDNRFSELDDSLTWKAEKTDLRITVTERGTLESQKTVNGICEVEGYDNKIIYIVEEGSTVKEGQVVVRIDSSEIDKEIAEEKLEVQQAKGVVETKLQEIEVTSNTGESEIAAADLELTLAELDLAKYRDGDYLVELNDLQGKIALAEVELEKAVEALQNTKELVKKGFREPEQIRSAEQQVESAKFSLERDKRQLTVLKDFDYKRKLTEFEANAKEAKRKLARAKANAEANLKKANNEHAGAVAELKLQEEDLAEANAQKERCEIKATQAGVVAYANEDWWSESRRIREGGTVYERQVVFFIPDMQLMQVEVKIHEAEVKRISAGQKALIRVDAFANQTFPGTVKSVAQLSKSESFFGGGVKEYPATITLDDIPSVPLRPGMTAEVEILVDNLLNVVAVPVQAIAEHRRQHYVYVRTKDQTERRDVEIGQSNNRLIEVISGIEPDDIVLLDARSRAAEEFADDDSPMENDELLKLKEQADIEAKDAAAEQAKVSAIQAEQGDLESTDTESAKTQPADPQSAEPIPAKPKDQTSPEAASEESSENGAEDGRASEVPQ